MPVAALPAAKCKLNLPSEITSCKLEPACWLRTAVFGTFVVASPKIAETCWKENPCATDDAFLNLGACKLEDGSRELQPVTLANK